MINLRDIDKQYLQGNTPVKVLNKLCLHVKDNENVGIIGPSGSGKSSLLHLLALLDEPTKGKIKIGGQDTNNLSQIQKDELRRKNISIIFQDNNLLNDFT